MAFSWPGRPTGGRGTTPGTATRLAGTGLLYSMFWNVNSLMTFLAVDDGLVTRQFDPLFRDDVPPPTVEIGVRLEAEAELDWDGSPRMSGLSLLASLSGVAPFSPPGCWHLMFDSGVTASD